jgi:hypothetical protein
MSSSWSMLTQCSVVFSGTQGRLRIIKYSHSFSFRFALSGLSLQHQELRFKHKWNLMGPMGIVFYSAEGSTFPEAHYAQG